MRKDMHPYYRFRNWLMHIAEDFWCWLAWKIPYQLVYWSFIRATTEAGCSDEYADRELMGLTTEEVSTFMVSDIRIRRW